MFFCSKANFLSIPRLEETSSSDKTDVLKNRLLISGSGFRLLCQELENGHSSQ